MWEHPVPLDVSSYAYADFSLRESKTPSFHEPYIPRQSLALALRRVPPGSLCYAFAALLELVTAWYIGRLSLTILAPVCFHHEGAAGRHL